MFNHVLVFWIIIIEFAIFYILHYNSFFCVCIMALNIEHSLCISVVNQCKIKQLYWTNIWLFKFIKLLINRTQLYKYILYIANLPTLSKNPRKGYICITNTKYASLRYFYFTVLYITNKQYTTQCGLSLSQNQNYRRVQTIWTALSISNICAYRGLVYFHGGCGNH